MYYSLRKSTEKKNARSNHLHSFSNRITFRLSTNTANEGGIIMKITKAEIGKLTPELTSKAGGVFCFKTSIGVFEFVNDGLYAPSGYILEAEKWNELRNKIKSIVLTYS